MQDSSHNAGPSRPRRFPPGMAWRSLSRLLLPLVLLLSLQGCAGGERSGKLQVMASIEPLAYFARRIGGDQVEVSVMVPPGADPHGYEPTPKQMARLASSVLFIKAGSGVEFELHWIPRMLELNRPLRICDASAGVHLIPMPGPGHDDGVVAHRPGGPDPHFWLAPANARVIAANVAEALAAADPANRSLYEANRHQLDGELMALAKELESRLSKVRRREFIVFHPAWGYFARQFGLRQIAVEQDGKSLTPALMARVIETARHEGISTVFVSPQFSSSQAEAIARDIGGSTVAIDPLSGDYQENLLRAATAIAGGMR